MKSWILVSEHVKTGFERWQTLCTQKLGFLNRETGEMFSILMKLTLTKNQEEHQSMSYCIVTQSHAVVCRKLLFVAWKTYKPLNVFISVHCDKPWVKGMYWFLQGYKRAYTDDALWITLINKTHFFGVFLLL